MVKPRSGHSISVRLISAEHDSLGRFGHRLAVASICLLEPVAVVLHFERRGQPMAREDIWRVAELRSSPHQLTLC